jgi:hypothetical protein
MHDPGGEDTLRTAIAVMLGHRIPVEGGTAAAVIDLCYGPDDHQPPPRARRRRTRWPRGTVVLRAVASEDGRTLAAWCVYCHREHTHGRHGACEPGTCDCQLHAKPYRMRRVPCTCPVGSGDGPRGAHCRPGSPLAERDYWVQEARP